jgi:cysteinyl-tRNA synthetase
MEIFNSMTRKKETFVPLREGEVKMYCCGPTVYNFIHVGNARPIIVFDVLRRYLEYRGYKVTFVQNFTDVDDKIIKRAGEEGIPASQVAEKYIKRIFYRRAGARRPRPATVHPKATENIPRSSSWLKRSSTRATPTKPAATCISAR